MSLQRPLIDAILATLTDPVEAVEIVNLQLDHFDGTLDQFGHVVLLTTTMLCGGRHDVAAALWLWDYLSDRSVSTIDVRFGIVATAFEYVRAAVPHTRDHAVPQTFGEAALLVASRRFRKKFIGPDQVFADLSWHQERHTMEQLMSLPLVEFEAGRYAESQLPDDMEVTEYLQMLLVDSETHKVHGTMELIERHVERLPGTFMQQRDLAICLLSTLLGTSSMETMDARLKAWLRGDQPDPELSVRRLGATITTLELLESFAQAERRTALAQAIINYVYGEHALGEAPEFNPESGTRNFGCPPEIDLKTQWEEYTAAA